MWGGGLSPDRFGDRGFRLLGGWRHAPRVLGPGTLVRSILLDVGVLALPDVPSYVAEHGDVVMVAAAADGGSLPKLASADDATEALALGRKSGGGAAPKRSAVIFNQATT